MNISVTIQITSPEQLRKIEELLSDDAVCDQEGEKECGQAQESVPHVPSLDDARNAMREYCNAFGPQVGRKLLLDSFGVGKIMDLSDDQRTTLLELVSKR